MRPGRPVGDGAVEIGDTLLVLLGALGAAALGPSAAEGQWLEAPGEGWADLAVYHQDTREAYDSRGTVRPFSGDGHAISTSTFLTLAGGLAPGIDAWIQVPYHRLEYDDLVDDRLRTGIGDTRFFLRTAPLEHLDIDFPFALRAGAKVPVGDFRVDAEVIPLGDGQRDWEVVAEVGHSFHPFPGYVSAWVGYRWRELDEDTGRDFGDEIFFLFQGGVSSDRWSFELVVEGLETVTDPRVVGLTIESLERRLVTLTPSVGISIGPGTASLGARFTLDGKNLPAGHALTAGYFTRWGF
ncbi:MAG: transporter [Longimicrobiales bacterium]